MGFPGKHCVQIYDQEYIKHKYNKSPTFSFNIPWCTNEWIIDLSMLPMSKPLQPSTRCILELCSERIQNTLQ
jgi:hypothetical protein